MEKIELIEHLQTLPKGQITPTIFATLNESLVDGVAYQLESDKNILKIHTGIKEGKNGSYSEMICAYDETTKNTSLIVTKKEYSPAYQRRYMIEEVGLNLFTQSSSYVFDQNDRMLHSSWFSDENKYYGESQMPLDYSPESLKEYFQDTNPKYQNGYFVSGPNSAYQPFTNIWQRYGDTNVVKNFGSNPMNGEYSDIAITFDDHSHEDIKLLSESYGQIYVPGRQMNLSGENEIVSTINNIYQNSKTHDGFDFDKFHSEFEETMFEPCERRIR